MDICSMQWKTAVVGRARMLRACSIVIRRLAIIQQQWLTFGMTEAIFCRAATTMCDYLRATCSSHPSNFPSKQRSWQSARVLCVDMKVMD
jgi:hypothetical protein